MLSLAVWKIGESLVHDLQSDLGIETMVGGVQLCGNTELGTARRVKVPGNLPHVSS